MKHRKKSKIKGARKRKHRGSMLIVALEVLALLSIFAVAFFMVMSVELTASRNAIDESRARFTAMAGVEAAVASIKELARQKSFTINNSNQRDPWIYEPNFKDGCGAIQSLEVSSEPSFAKTVGGKVISGEVGASYPGGMDYYRLKVWDHASRLNINGPQETLAQTLENLGEGIALYTNLPNPVASGKGQEIIDYRNSLSQGRFRNVHELEGVIGADNAEILSHFITFRGWKAPSTKRPLPSNETVATKPDISQTYHSYDSVQNRFPINVNTASKPVLYAVLKGIKGYKTVTTETGSKARGSRPVQFTKGAGTEIEFSDSKKVQDFVDALFNSREKDGNFRSWEQFLAFLLDSAKSKLTRDEAEAIFANAYPGARLNKFSPPPALQPGYTQGGAFSMGIDKTDLTYHTTEFCFSSMGYFHIECRGYVESSKGSTVSTAKVKTDVQIYQVLRLSSQLDFFNYKTKKGSGSIYENGKNGIMSAPNPVEILGENLKPPSASIGWLQFEPIPPLELDEALAEVTMEKSLDEKLEKYTFTKKGTKKENLSLFEGGDLSAEGLISWWNRDRQLYYTIDSDWPTTLHGGVEFWVKLLVPPNEGSNEVFLYYNRSKKIGPKQVGTTFRLERYGSELVATRFYWGDRSPYATVWNQVVANIEDWKANEWHHVAVTWDRLKQKVYIDGKEATLEQDLPDFTPGVTVNLRGVTVTLSPDRINIFRLISHSPDFHGYILGGYNFDAGSGGELYQTNVTMKGKTTRYANAVFDDFRIYKDLPNFLKNESPPASRYGADATPNPNSDYGAYYELNFPLPPGTSLASLGWTVWYPEEYQSGGSLRQQVYSKGSTKNLDVRLSYKVAKSWWILPEPQSGQWEGEGAPLQSMKINGKSPETQVGDNGLTVRIEMLNKGNLDPLNVTPVLDDLSLVYFVTPEYLTYRWIEE